MLWAEEGFVNTDGCAEGEGRAGVSVEAQG